TIIRTADAVGADGVILTKGSVDVFSDKTVRATMGSLFHLPVVTDVSAEEVATFAQAAGCQLLATALDEQAKQHFAVDFGKGSLIAFGNEGGGVSEELLAAAEKVYIPMYGEAESLNVGVSSAVVLYEAVRQRHFA
ncbi:TrmH family RNA methyltransferase, partial [Mitsuokella multacida]